MWTECLPYTRQEIKLFMSIISNGHISNATKSEFSLSFHKDTSFVRSINLPQIH